MKKTKQTKKIPQSISLSKQTPEYSLAQVTHPQKRLFLETYYATGNVSKTCNMVKVHRRTYYNWLENDPCFNYLISEQKAQLLDEIDEICRNQAKTLSKSGTTERIFWLKTHHPDYKNNDVLAYRDQNVQFVLTRGH